MKIFLSSLENVRCQGYEIPNLSSRIIENGIKMKWNLMSFYYISKKNGVAEQIRDNSELVVIDSGAHSFQFGRKVDFDKYVNSYAEWIKTFDRPNVLGYFELDADNVFGYEKVLEYRRILKQASDKIIPVWHKERGIEDFYKMCHDYAGKVISITGFKNADIRDDQYLQFVKYAKKYHCKVFCLGMTRTQVLNKVPFDYCDSSSWASAVRYGRPFVKTKNGVKFPKPTCPKDREDQMMYSYLQGMEMQEKYYKKWRKACEKQL